jgi:hypothetical protein
MGALTGRAIFNILGILLHDLPTPFRPKNVEEATAGSALGEDRVHSTRPSRTQRTREATRGFDNSGQRRYSLPRGTEMNRYPTIVILRLGD